MKTEILPDFIIIGAMKAGTTTLYEYLSGHSEVGMSREKETDYFIAGRGLENGLNWYHSQFKSGYRIYGEASPNYTKLEAFPNVADRVADLLPNCRLIFIARDPVKRAESQYRHAVLSGADVPSPKGLSDTHHLQHLIDTSSYAKQLKPWLDRFPREQILFLKFEDLIADKSQTLCKLAKFLEITNSWPVPSEIVANSSDSLARLPSWLFGIQRLRVLRFIKRGMSAKQRKSIKSILSMRQARPTSELPFEILNVIRHTLKEDFEKFQELSGLRY